MPVWEAQYVTVIASKTGLSPEQIRWDLPLWQGRAYYHAARVLEGERFRWPGAASRTSRWLGKVREWARRKMNNEK